MKIYAEAVALSRHIQAEHRLHIGFDDPAEATGTQEEVLAVFRRVRNEINQRFRKFYNDNLTGK